MVLDSESKSKGIKEPKKQFVMIFLIIMAMRILSFIQNRNTHMMDS